MSEPGYLSARQAAAELGVSIPTIYAYVSRGLIRSEAITEKGHERRYIREDIEQLKARKEQRLNSTKAAQQALYWGAPVIESALTLISGGKYFYRGYDATLLARTQTIEQVAMLLWTGGSSHQKGNLFGRRAEPILENDQEILAQAQNYPLIEAFQVSLALAATRDPAAYDLRPLSVARTGARILQLLAIVAARQPSQVVTGIPRLLQQSWAPGQPGASELINAALILSADHELNVSSFTARCVASAGSSPYAVVIAGLSALQGTKHGGFIRKVEALFDEIEGSQPVEAVLSGRLKRGEVIPGFGHRLYPEGDPRARMLLELAAHAFPDSSPVRLSRAISGAVFKLIGEHPTIDFGLVAFSRALSLPEDGAMALFALGRSAGWIAHAIEQYQIDQLIRPRASYVGPLPE